MFFLPTLSDQYRAGPLEFIFIKKYKVPRKGDKKIIKISAKALSRRFFILRSRIHIFYLDIFLYLYVEIQEAIFHTNLIYLFFFFLSGFMTLRIYHTYWCRGRTRTGTKFPSRDFKSLVSTNSTTWANLNNYITLRLRSESNRRRRICNPLHNHFATQP